MTIDLADLDTVAACDQGADIQILHPVTRAPTGAVITVLGSDSAVFKNKVREDANRRRRILAAQNSRGKKEEVRTIEEDEKDNIALLAACTFGWTHDGKPSLLLGGKDVAFSKEAAIEVYTKYPFIFEQVREAITELENFMKK